MTSRDFCFWLQGYFELTEHDLGPTDTAEGTHIYRNHGLTGGQVECVMRHLQLVFTHEGRVAQSSVARDFCVFLQGLLTYSSGEPSKAIVDGIKERLHNVFTHEIDPSMGGPEHQAELNAVHSPPAKPHRFGGQGPNGTLLRC